MPAEAIHLSALADTLESASAYARAATASPRLHAAARLGALYVDLPYFDRFALAVVNYLRKRPQVGSRWGGIHHTQTPIARGRLLGEAGVRLSRQAQTREAGEYLVALALGYISHAAVDRSMHPLVNRLAAERAQRLSTAHSVEHQEVEKFQSILFHEARFGFDFMGRVELSRHVTVEAEPLWKPGPVASALDRVLRELHGEAPGPELLKRWARGYSQYVWLISGPLGKTVAPAAAKERERGWSFVEVDFPARFTDAVAQSRRWVDALSRYLADGAFDAGARAELEAVVPEGTIDPGAPGA